jgi:hypothetical protein
VRPLAALMLDPRAVGVVDYGAVGNLLRERPAPPVVAPPVATDPRAVMIATVVETAAKCH